MRIAKVGFVSSVLTLLLGGVGVDFLGDATAFVTVLCVIIYVVAIFRGNAKANYLDGGLVMSSALLVAAFGMLLDYHDLQASGSKCNCSVWIVAFMVLAIGVAVLGGLMEMQLGRSKKQA